MQYIQLITCSASMIIEDAGGRLCWQTSWTGNMANTIKYVMYRINQATSGNGIHECLFECHAIKMGKADIAMTFITSQMLTTVEGFPNAHLRIDRSSVRLKESKKGFTSQSIKDEVFSILNGAHTWARVILAGKCDSRCHSITSFSKSLVVVEITSTLQV